MSANRSPDTKHGSSRRDITLPAWHDGAISRRMQEQGIGRSEAVRQMIRESVQQQERVNRFALKRLVGILRLNVAAIRLTPGKPQDVLRAMDCTIEELDRLADA